MNQNSFKGEELIQQEHPLQSAWDVTYVHKNITKNNKKDNEVWSTAIQPICSFKLLEEAKYTIQEVPSPSQWPINSNLQIFREGIRPAWEDAMNHGGGRLMLKIECDINDEGIFSFPNHLDKSRELKDYKEEVDKAIKNCIDNLFKEIFYFIISESYKDKSDIVNGFVYSPRRINPRIFLWLRNDHIFEGVHYDFQSELQNLISNKNFFELKIKNKVYTLGFSITYETHEIINNNNRPRYGRRH